MTTCVVVFLLLFSSCVCGQIIIDGFVSDWNTIQPVNSNSSFLLDWRIGWNETDFYVCIQDTSSSNFSALYDHAFIAFGLEPTADDFVITNFISDGPRADLDIPFKADIILDINFVSAASYLFTGDGAAYTTAFVYSISPNGKAWEGSIKDSRFANSIPTSMLVAGFVSPKEEQPELVVPKPPNSYFGFFTATQMNASFVPFIETLPFGTQTVGSWQDNSTWIGDSPGGGGNNVHAIIRHQVSATSSNIKLASLTTMTGGQVILTNTSLRVGDGTQMAYLTAADSTPVTMDGDSFLLLTSPATVSGSPIAVVNLRLTGTSSVNFTTSLNISAELRISSAKFRGPPVVYEGGNLVYDDRSQVYFSPGPEWIELSDPQKLNSSEVIGGVPRDLTIDSNTYLDVNADRSRGIRGSLSLLSGARMNISNCPEFIALGNVNIENGSLITLVNSSIQAHDIDAADTGIFCKDNASYVVINNETPWPYLTVIDEKDNVVSWKSNVSTSNPADGIKLKLPSGWTTATWIRGENQTVSESNFLTVTAYGDYRVDSLHISSNCKSSLKFSVVPASQDSKKDSGADKTLIIAIVVPSMVALAAFVFLAALLIRRRKKKTSIAEDQESNRVELKSQGKENWEIDYNEITIQKELGRGAFGVVYLSRWRNTDCVVKQLDANKTDLQSVKQFLKEANNVKDLRSHPNVCTIFGICTNPTCIVMEYVPGGSLEDFLYKDKLKITAQVVIEWAKDVASGMGHLHKENILHCDLAARNLLVNPLNGKYVLKIADFGLSRVTETDTYNASKESSFPIRWTAPEALRGGKISRASDVWSFGVVLWEIIECKKPYPMLTNAEVMQQVCDKGLKPSFPEKIEIPKELWQLMQKCWASDPDERPSFNEIYEELERIEQANFPKEGSKELYFQSSKVTEYQSSQYNTTNNSSYTTGPHSEPTLYGNKQ